MKQRTLTQAQAEEKLRQLYDELWAQNLNDPEVWEALVERKASLRILTPWEGGFMAVMLCWAVFLGLSVHELLAVPVVVLVLAWVARKRARVIRERERLELLTGPPEWCFRGIAANKIIMEIMDRSPEVNRYQMAKDAGGRFASSNFENQMFIKILNTLDQLESR